MYVYNKYGLRPNRSRAGVNASGSGYGRRIAENTSANTPLTSQVLNKPEADTNFFNNDTDVQPEEELSIYSNEIGNEADSKEKTEIDLSLNRENILKGIIFSEIIGKARGRNPRHPNALFRK